jgi:thioredoxin-related protein
MKLLAFVIATFLTINSTWLGNFGEAQKQAAQEHKLILVNFSGSDWCGPCIRLRKEILESATFEDYAAQNLVLVRADFPREKKNQPGKEQIKLNNALADKYNPNGKFPYTLLIDDAGKILQTWEGFPNLTPEQFVGQIQQYH